MTRYFRCYFRTFYTVLDFFILLKKKYKTKRKYIYKDIIKWKKPRSLYTIENKKKNLFMYKYMDNICTYINIWFFFFMMDLLDYCIFYLGISYWHLWVLRLRFTHLHSACNHLMICVIYKIYTYIQELIHMKDEKIFKGHFFFLNSFVMILTRADYSPI